eukprot:scaffold37873_cov27-Tisochrysis_lutea.AAC.3
MNVGTPHEQQADLVLDTLAASPRVGALAASKHEGCRAGRGRHALQLLPPALHCVQLVCKLGCAAVARILKHQRQIGLFLKRLRVIDVLCARAHEPRAVDVVALYHVVEGAHAAHIFGECVRRWALPRWQCLGGVHERLVYTRATECSRKVQRCVAVWRRLIDMHLSVEESFHKALVPTQGGRT